MIIAASDFMIAWWWLVLLVVVGAIFGFLYLYKRSQKMQHFIDRFMLKIPVVGKILHEAAIARFARTLAVKIGRAACRERVCRTGYISGVAVALKKKKNR